MKNTKDKRTEERSEVGDYINEHELSVLLSLGRNSPYFGPQARKTSKEAREKFDAAYANYQRCLEESGEKRNSLVQQYFKEALWESQFVEPTKEEIERVSELILLLARRCLRTFGRNSRLNEKELGSLTFERWVRYRENFDPLKKSDITGNRVNAFAYMTQVIKNIIFADFNENKKEVSSETLPLSVLEDLEDSDILLELEECKEMLLKESKICTDLEKCLLKISERNGVDPDIIVKTIVFYDLMPTLEETIRQNIWDF